MPGGYIPPPPDGVATLEVPQHHHVIAAARGPSLSLYQFVIRRQLVLPKIRHFSDRARKSFPIWQRRHRWRTTVSCQALLAPTRPIKVQNLKHFSWVYLGRYTNVSLISMIMVDNQGISHINFDIDECTRTYGIFLYCTYVCYIPSAVYLRDMLMPVSH